MNRHAHILQKTVRRWPLLSAVLLLAVVLMLIPFGDRPQRVADGIVVAELVLFALVATWLVTSDPARQLPGRPKLAVTGLAIAAALYAVWVGIWWADLSRTQPVLDDVIYLRAAENLSLTELLTPHNEHCVLLPKLYTAAAVRVAAIVNLDSTIVGRLGLFLVFFLLAFRTFRICTGSQVAAAVGLAFLALVPALNEVVLWYSASLWLIPLILFLFAVPDAVDGRGGWRVGLAAALGPTAFWTGVLVGPALALCAWAAGHAQRPRRWSVRQIVLMAIGATTAGSVLSLAVARSGEQHVAWHDLLNLTVWVRATVFAGRFLADHTTTPLLGPVLQGHVFAYPIRLGLALGALLVLLYWATARRLVGAVLLTAAISFAMCFLARSDLAYELALRRSDRYHVWGHLAVAWLVSSACAGWVRSVVDRHAERSPRVGEVKDPCPGLHGTADRAPG